MPKKTQENHLRRLCPWVTPFLEVRFESRGMKSSETCAIWVLASGLPARGLPPGDRSGQSNQPVGPPGKIEKALGKHTEGFNMRGVDSVGRPVDCRSCR